MMSGRAAFNFLSRSVPNRLCIRCFCSPAAVRSRYCAVVIVVILNGSPHVIMDGVVTNHEIVPGNDAGHATLSITGEDLSVLMDKIDFSGFPFPALPAEGRVALMLLKICRLRYRAVDRS